MKKCLIVLFVLVSTVHFINSDTQKKATKLSKMEILFNDFNRSIDRRYNSTNIHDLKTQLSVTPKYNNGKIISIETSTNGIGILKKENGFYILKLSGTQFEMGYQHGYLLADVIQDTQAWNQNRNLVDYWSKYFKRFSALVNIAGSPFIAMPPLVDRITSDDFRALYGCYLGYKAGIENRTDIEARIKDLEPLDKYDFIKGYILPDICSIAFANTLGGRVALSHLVIDQIGNWDKNKIGTLGCTSVAVLPRRSEKSDLLFGFNFDYGPLAGLWEKNLTIIYFKPLPEDDEGNLCNKNKPQTYIALTSAGMHTAGLMGINASGVTFRVQVNFANATDRGFDGTGNPNGSHGQPLLNFGSEILRKATNINDVENIITSTKSGIYGVGTNYVQDYIAIKNLTEPSPASCWSFIITQAKTNPANNTDISKALVRETIYKYPSGTECMPCNTVATCTIPVKFSKLKDSVRYALFKDTIGINDDDIIKIIWQTNFFLDPNVHKTDIFDRRSNQLDRLGRYIRFGKLIKEKYLNRKNTFKWQDIAEMLGDHSDIFSGNQERLNVHTIASLSTVTTGIFSVKPNNKGNPTINIYLANRADKRTPSSWGDYYKLDYNSFDEFNDTDKYNICLFSAIYNNNQPKNKLDDCTCYEDQPKNKPDDNTMLVWNALYDIYCKYTLNYPKVDVNNINIIIADYNNLINAMPDKNQTIDPIIYLQISRLNSQLAKWEAKDRNYTDAINHLKEAKKNLYNALHSNDKFKDIHLKFICKYDLSKIYYVLYHLTGNNPDYVKANKTFKNLQDEIIKGSSYLLNGFEDSEIPNVFQSFVDNPKGSGKRLLYKNDQRLKEAIENIYKDINNDFRYCWPEDLEDDISFDGTEYFYFNSKSNNDKILIRQKQMKNRRGKWWEDVRKATFIPKEKN